VGSSGCGAGAVPSKQAKQTSKGLVFDAVRVRWWCGAKQTSKDKQGFGAGCGCGAVVLNKQARVRCLVPVRVYLSNGKVQG
jgi:hypothetical protein